MKRTILSIVFVSLCGVLIAQINMPALFHDGMVLQRNQVNKLWGTAKAGQQLTLTFGGQVETTNVNADGSFTFTLEGLEASNESRTLTIASETSSLKIEDVVVGDVFLLSGQSNMAWKIKQLGTPYTDNVKKDADYPDIRYYAVSKNLDADFEQIYGNKGVPDKPWLKTNQETVMEYSAVGFYFGRKLYKEKQVSIGLIDCSQGSSYAEAWISEDYIERHVDLKPYLVSSVQSGNAQYYRNPGVLYENMLSRVLPYTVCSVLWYQGEANASYYQNYHKVLPAVIDCFRESYDNDALPFVIIQLSGYENTDFWPYIREVQDSVAKVTLYSALVSTIDVGEAERIHPRDKEPVGERCALAVRSLVFGEDVVCSGPTFRSIRIEGNKAVITFDHANGLHTQTDLINGFEICDRNYHYLPATNAEIRGNEIAIWNNSIGQPEAVRYAWSNYPSKNLYNAEGLPANPFRTSKHAPITTSLVYYVVPGGSGLKTGYDWENALDLSTETLRLGKSGDQFWVKSGVYPVHIQYSERILYGGFDGTETQLEQRDWAKNPTILQGEENAIDPLVVLQSTAVLDGFVLQDNKLASTGAATKHGGGAQLGRKSIIRNCVVRNNSTTGLNNNTTGGGIYVSGKDEYGTFPIIENCLIHNNAAPNNGGGIQIGNGASLRLIGSTVTGNLITKADGETGSGYGCGVGLGSQTKLIAENSIVYNNGKSNGIVFSFGIDQGGVTGTELTLRNCAHDAMWNGSETYGGVSFKEMTDCISNLSVERSPAFCRPLAFYGTTSLGSEQYNLLVGSDYSLLPTSICIDAGRSSASLCSKDLAGHDRKLGTAVDIGAYETVPNTSMAQQFLQADCYVQHGVLTIDGVTEGDWVYIYDASGRKVCSILAATSTVSIKLPDKGLYIIKFGNKIAKVVCF